MLTPVITSILYISICENEVRQGISTGDNVRVLKLITLAFYLCNVFEPFWSIGTHLYSVTSSPSRPLLSNPLAFLTGAGEKDGAALSSWARYLKSKYGNRGKEAAGSSPAGTSTPARRSSVHSRQDDSDDESKNLYGSPNVPTATTAPAAQTGKRSAEIRVSECLITWEMLLPLVKRLMIVSYQSRNSTLFIEIQNLAAC